MFAKIIDRGRGPDVAGTRITVYNILDFSKHGWHRDRIAAHFGLSSNQVQAALDYIKGHEQEVETQYQEIRDRHRDFKYPPDVQAKVDACRGAAERRRAELRASGNGSGNHADDSV